MPTVFKYQLWIWLVTLFSLNLSFLSADENTKEPQRIDIWNGKAPIDDGQYEETEVWITVYLAAKPTGTAFVICPGGGYSMLAKEPEGHGIAKWLNGHGISGIVLEYRLPAGRTYVPLMDVKRAIRTTRANAKQWAIDPHRIGVIGFSAGGHLASTAVTHFDEGKKGAADPIDRISSRPDFGVLVYPVVTMGEKGHQGSRTNLLGKEPTPAMIELFSNEKQVTDKTPPTFMAHAVDDYGVVIDNSRMFYQALQAHKVPSELLELPSGGHGLDGYKGPMWDAWQERSLAWLSEILKTPGRSAQ